MYTPSLIALSALAFAADSYAAVLAPRAVECPAVSDAVDAAAAQATATRFCSSYLGITTRTRVMTSTTATTTITVNRGTYVTSSIFVTPDVVTKVRASTQTVRVTTTPSTITKTQTETKTAYINDAGSTMALLKRAEATGLAKRAAIPTPVIFNGYPRADMTSACKCLDIPTPTANKIVRVRATTTVTRNMPRTIRVTSTNAASTTTSVSVATKSVFGAAKAPLSTAVVEEVIPSYSCPPTWPRVFQCPEGTADDVSEDSQVLACGVDTADEYQGFCQYWSDDGSAAGSILTLGDGTGETDGDQTREATYGESMADDCAPFADYLCDNPSAGGSRLVRMAMLRARQATGTSSLAPTKKTKAEKAAHKKLGKKKIPVPPPKRGGRMLGFVSKK